MFESLLLLSVRIPVTSEYKNFVYEVAKRARNEFKLDFSVDDVHIFDFDFAFAFL
jgi:hypothetical protein